VSVCVTVAVPPFVDVVKLVAVLVVVVDEDVLVTVFVKIVCPVEVTDVLVE